MVALQGQVIDLAGWYDEMKQKDDFSDYAGRRSIMEAQADLVQARWESGLDQYDRTTMNSQQPNFSCRVQLPSYFYIPNLKQLDKLDKVYYRHKLNFAL